MKLLACVLFEVNGTEEAGEVLKKVETVFGAQVVDAPLGEVTYRSDWRKELDELLTALGENISHKGYNIMFDIMEYVEANPELQNNFTVKELYSYVTKKTGIKYDRIDRNIRATIDRINKNNTEEHINSVLRNNGQAKMTNSSFISLIIQKLFR